MKNIIEKALKKIVDYLLHILDKLDEKPDTNKHHHYHSLSPTNNAQKVETYLEAIEWALKNSKRIKNIAISGSYGSGKSSVIETFIERNKNKTYKFLKISLATFKEARNKEKGNHTNETNNQVFNDNNDILRLIELSVLQQLFYHEKDKNIPDSRFKKIKNHKTRYLFFYTTGFIALLISVLFLLYPSFLSKFYLITLPPKAINIAHYTASLIALIGLFFIVFKSSRVLKNLTIKKLDINNAKIEIDNGISKSILNNHIDEILYFFEVTSYNVVFIEDLDRFEQTEVFTKLREINLLINNSQKVKNDVVFIYAIKDDMFMDKDRTKFFDFMIPIIPVINSSNSNEMLLNIVNKNDYKISPALLDDISLFIDDLRLLYNIMNEYYIYSRKLKVKLNSKKYQTKLLSMIVYKNIYPNDFTLLNQNKGFLFKVINEKANYVKEEINLINEKIEDLKEKIEEVERTQLSDIKDLRRLYVNFIIQHITEVESKSFLRFKTDNKEITIDELLEDSLFSKLIEHSVSYVYSDYYYSSRRNGGFINFDDIETKFDKELNYKQREQLILDKKQINKFKKQISELENQKVEIRKSRLKDLIQNKVITLDGENNKQSQLVNLLLRNGYIDEHYLDYITIFYEGSLAKMDYQFLINVKTQTSSEFDYKLTKIDKLINKIEVFDFEKEYILNNGIVETLLESSKYNDKKEKLFKQLSNQSKTSIGFIDQFIETTSSIELFISTICKYWSNIWIYIYEESIFEDKKKENYFINVLKYSELDDFNKIFASHKAYLNNRTDFLNLIDNESRIKAVIRDNGLKFNKLNYNSPKSLLEYVYSGNYYKINRENLELFLKFHNKFDADYFFTANYSCILNSSLSNMEKYINDNLQDYIQDVYLNIESNTKEPLESYLELLNSVNLDNDTKEKLIIKVETKISDIATIENEELWNILLDKSKIYPSWKNILKCFENEGNSFNEHLINFINDISNAEELSKIKMDTEVDDENIFGKLCRELIYANGINKESFDLVTKSIPWWYSDIGFEKISSEERVVILLNNSVIKPSKESFLSLKENYNNLHIELFEKFTNDLTKIIDDLELDVNDLEALFESTELDYDTKNIILSHSDTDVLNSSAKILKILSSDILNEKHFNELGESTLKEILLCTEITSVNRIKIFNENFSNFDNSFIESFIKSLNSPYDKIANYDKRALLEDNNLNRLFLNNLKTKGFISSVSEEKKGLRVNHKQNR